MTLAQMLEGIHKQIEIKELKDITKKEISDRLGIANITYIEWLRGVNSPQGMSTLLKMLAILNDDRIIMVIRSWQHNRRILKLCHIIHKIHKQIEDIEMKDISQKEMAQRLGISLSAYASWLGDTKRLKAMSALLDMLAILDDEDMVRVVREWESSKKEKSKEDKKMAAITKKDIAIETLRK